MGGGVGVSLNGSHRIAGEGFAFAMPEVGIGFFPDVGATFFLPRLPGRLGTLLALTGERVKTADAVASGLADAFVPAARHDDLVAALADGEPVEPVVARLTAAAGDGPLMAARATIDRLFAGDTVESVLASLDTDTGDLPTRWAAAIRTKSPTSLKIALRQMQTGGRQTFAEAMRTEFRIVSRLIDGHDFTEGVRALIIDKDYRPAWQPATLAAVDDGEIDRHVAPLGADELPD
jgi:enoyl-CoA hydratase